MGRVIGKFLQEVVRVANRKGPPSWVTDRWREGLPNQCRNRQQKARSKYVLGHTRNSSQPQGFWDTLPEITTKLRCFKYTGDNRVKGCVSKRMLMKQIIRHYLSLLAINVFSALNLMIWCACKIVENQDLYLLGITMIFLVFVSILSESWTA